MKPGPFTSASSRDLQSSVSVGSLQRGLQSSVSAGGHKRGLESGSFPQMECGSFPHDGAYSASGTGCMPSTMSEKHGRCLRVISVGPCLVRGGAEQWLIYLSRFVDPRRVQFVRTIVTRPELIDPAFVADVPIPVEVGQADAVQRAAAECDILLGWGLAMDQLLVDARPPVCAFVAHGEGPWTRKMLEASAQVVDHVIAVSQRVKDRVCQGFPTTVIHNGVDTSRLGQTCAREETRSALGFQPGDFVMGYVGRFSPEKGVDRIIEAIKRLPSHFKALFVGWGAERAALMDQANACIPGRFAFARADDYLGDYYGAMDAFCLVSHEEGCSLALLEALLCGRPVIASGVGAAPELLQDRVNGLVISGHARSLSKAAQLLHDHPNWARGLAAEGLALGHRIGHAQRMAREYEALFDRLVRKHAGPHHVEEMA